MASKKAPTCGEHFRTEKLKEWPEAESVAFMEALAREDIDEAVRAILFRENYVAKRLDTYFQHLDIFKERRKEMLHKKWIENVAEPLQQRITDQVISYRQLEKMKQENTEYFLQHTNKRVMVPSFCDPLFRRQQEMDEEKSAVFQYKTGKGYTLKEFKDLEKAGLYAKLPQFTFTLHSVFPKERHKASARSLISRTHSKCSSEKIICSEKKCLPDKENKTTDLSQTVFERKFRSLKLSQENKRDEKNCVVGGTRQHRPRSWAAGEGQHQWQARGKESEDGRGPGAAPGLPAAGARARPPGTVPSAGRPLAIKLC